MWRCSCWLFVRGARVALRGSVFACVFFGWAVHRGCESVSGNSLMWLGVYLLAPWPGARRPRAWHLARSFMHACLLTHMPSHTHTHARTHLLFLTHTHATHTHTHTIRTHIPYVHTFSHARPLTRPLTHAFSFPLPSPLSLPAAAAALLEVPSSLHHWELPAAVGIFSEGHVAFYGGLIYLDASCIRVRVLVGCTVGSFCVYFMHTCF